MADIIVIAGSPGSGKHTVARLVRAALDTCPHVDLGHLREFHLDFEWKREHEAEEAMAFGNLVHIIQSYLDFGFSNIIVTDLRDHRVRQMPDIFDRADILVASLVVPDESILEARIRARTGGFRNVEAALAWNRALMERPLIRGEVRIDNSVATPQETCTKILALSGK